MASGWDKETARHSVAKRFGKAPPYRNKAGIQVFKSKTGYHIALEKKPAWQEGIDLSKDSLTEREILLIKRRLNNNKMTPADLQKTIGKGDACLGIKITPTQTSKGLNWLNDQWKTPTGEERKNNPFGYREQEALRTFKRFELTGFYDSKSSFSDFHNYIPIYTVFGSGNSFDYYVAGGEIHITG